MKVSNNKQHPQGIKRKLMSSLAMLLVSTILLTTTSYAWFVLSTAPEVTGIETQVGANGSLEIALLNTETRIDMSKIRSGALGESLAADNQAANNAWGNLIDLGYTSYGLSNILLLPARLNAVGNPDDGYTVDPGMLAIPTYGYDGRVIDLTDNTVTAVYQGNRFAFTSGVQDYGVRAVGSADSLSAQESALANAKGNIPTYTKSSRTNAQSVLANSGDAVFDIMIEYMAEKGAASYDNEARDALKIMLQDLRKSTQDIDLALRQGLVAYASSELGDEATFNLVKDEILDTSKSLKDLIKDQSGMESVPAEFMQWVNALDNMQNDLNAAVNACNALTSGVYSWQDIRGILNYVMNMDYVYIQGVPLDQLDIQNLYSSDEILMELIPGSGIFTDIADFTGTISSSMKAMGKTVVIKTVTSDKTTYLSALSVAVNGLTAATGGSAAEFPLTTTYGYALDLAFRCNAPAPDLVLQTKGVQRVYEESESTSTQGGGSYMAFNSSDAALTQEQKLLLMDAIRVGFLDDQGKLLAVAKPNISNYVMKDGLLNAPLYLYNYSFSAEDGAMIMGERKVADNLITDEMQQNVAKALTVIVWLDGDIVDNSMVSATEASSLSGMLNLQFATSAELVPSVDGILMNYTADKTGLQAAIDTYKATLEAGQSISSNEEATYTNVSWSAFATAFNRAEDVNENADASAVEVANALRNLLEAAKGLEAVSKDAVNNKITQLREEMGQITDEVGRVVVKNSDGTYSAMGGADYTQDEYDSWEKVGEIYRVDYNKNLNNEGNDLYTPHYTDATWNALANALYEAEAVAMNPDATEDEINAALTALDNAQKALSRQVFFKPYEYRGVIYYEAICDAENADTYGKWYDSNFQRILSELTILNLDAYAEPATIIEMGQGIYVASDAGYITPDVNFLEEVFPELLGVEVQGVQWNDVDSKLFTVMMLQQHYAKLLELVYIADTDLILEKIGTSTNPDVQAYGDTMWLPSDEIADSKTAPGTMWQQIRDAEGYPVRRLTCGDAEHVHVNICYQNTCGVAEHAHSDTCSRCPVQEHMHSLACYNTEGDLTCGVTEHQHDVFCAIANACQLEEHAHVDACYDLPCPTPAHAHSAENGCYDAEEKLICEETVHAHVEGTCGPGTLLCRQKEHTHDNYCYEYKWEVVDEDNAVPAYYATAKANAKAILAKWENNQEVTAEAAKTAIADLNNAIVKLYAENIKLLEQYDNADMTANQRILLTAAVNAAKALENYEAEENAALRTATEFVENLLASDITPTRADAAEALVKLNEQLVKVEATAISESNTLTHRIPDGQGSADIVYDVDYPGIKLKLTGKTGVATLSAQVLTTDGVVVNVEKEITVYERAESVTMLTDNKTVGSLNLYNGESGVLETLLKYKKVNLNAVREQVKSYTWASTNTEVVTVTANSDGTATFETAGIGTAKISVSVVTVEGNVYAHEIPVIVYGLAHASGVGFVSNGAGINALILNEDGEEPQTAVVSAELWYGEIPSGYIAEEVKSYYFTSSNKSVFTVKNKLDGTATITAVAPGAASLNVQITTVNGSTYEEWIPVYVQCDYVIGASFDMIGKESHTTEMAIDETATIQLSEVYYVNDGTDVTAAYKEKIASYTCASDDENVVTVINNHDGTFTVTAVGPGEAAIHVQAISESGGLRTPTYFSRFEIVVPEPEETPTENPTEMPTEEPAE